MSDPTTPPTTPPTAPPTALPTADQILDLVPYARFLGVVLDEVGPQRAVGHLDHDVTRTTGGGGFHGGALMGLADFVGAVVAHLSLPPGGNTTTTASSTMFLRAVRSGRVTATATPLHVGRSTIVVCTEVRDDAGRLVSQTTQSQAVLTS